MVQVPQLAQDYGSLTMGAETKRDVAIEVSSNGKVTRSDLTLKLAFTTASGESKTQEYTVCPMR